MEHDYFFTSESVSEGYPDKLADRVLDAIIAIDPRGVGVMRKRIAA